MIADAFDKCADNLFKDDEMDIDAEIQVMKTMLTGDSLLENAVNDIRVAKRRGRRSPGGGSSRRMASARSS